MTDTDLTTMNKPELIAECRRGRWPRCPRCACSLPDPDDALGDPDACPCCHYTGPAEGPG